MILRGLRPIPHPPAAFVTNPAIDVRLLQEACHHFHTQASQCWSRNRGETILLHEATLQWMYD